MNPRISMITLGVRDLASAVKFYEQGLGFPRMESPPEVAFFTLNGTWLGLYAREALAEDATVSAQGSGFEGFTLSHNVSSEAEVEKVMGQALAAGAPATSKIRMAICGRWPTIPIFGSARVTMTANKLIIRRGCMDGNLC